MKKEESEKALQAFNEELLRGMKEKREKALQAYEEAYSELQSSMSSDDHIVALGKIGNHLINGVYGSEGDIATLLIYRMLRDRSFAKIVLKVAKIFKAHKGEMREMVGEAE